MSTLARACLAFAAAASLATIAHADDAGPPAGLLGDWGGRRAELYRSGIDFQLSYFNEFAYNTGGGSARLARYADQAVAGVSLDLDKLWGWPKAKFQLTLTDRNGKNLSADAELGTLMQVQQVYGRGTIVRLTELSYQQSFADGLVDVKLGRLPVGGDFFPWSCEFMNLSFCGSLPGNVVSTWYNWPVSQWAGRVQLAFAPEWDVKAGVYQIDPGYLDNANGLRLGSPAGTVGALLPIELTWSPRIGAEKLPGTYRIGAWYDTSTQPDVYLAANGQPLVLNPGVPPMPRRGEHGWYLDFQQQVTRVDGDDNRGLALFANWVQADRDTATIDQLLSLGFLYTGPLPGRPRDVAGFAAGRTRVNPRVADGQALQNAAGPGPAIPVQNAEYPFEFFYSFVATPWLTVAPAIQYIHRPGGTSANPDATVVGLNLLVTF